MVWSYESQEEYERSIASKRIFLSAPHMSEEGYERQFVQEAFDTNWIAPAGRNITLFEEEMAQKIGVSKTVALSSGTAAIHMALKAAGVNDGDTVMCSTLTFSASANPIRYVRANPVFVDSDEKTWNMDPNALEKALQLYPDTKAVIVVHLYGLCADLDPIMEICKRHNVTVIEDSAESLGALYRGKQVGTIGDYGVFSFNGNKIITTSGGGMLVGKDEERLDKVRFWSTQARDLARCYQHSELGFNYRMSNVLAGIGRGQLRVLPRRVEKKKYIFEFYRKAFADIPDIQMMPINEWNEPNYWLTCITLHGSVRPIDIMRALEDHQIECRPIWKPMHLQPFFEACPMIGGSVAESIFENGVCLPSDTKMTDEQLTEVCGIIKGLWKK